jgi:heptosyltransferase-2
MNRPYKRILVIRFSSVGDILLTTPVLRALKRWDQGAELHFAVKSEYALLLRENPNVDEIIQLDTELGISGFLKYALGLRGKYDLLVDLHRSIRSLIIRRLTGARMNLKYPKGVISRSLMIRTGWKAIAMKEPIPERYLKALEPLEITQDERGIDFPIPETIQESVLASIVEEAASINISKDFKRKQEHDSYLALAPGARWATKRWLPERFAEVSDTLAEKYNLIPVLIGHSDEKSVSRAVKERMKYTAIDFTGKLDLLETGAVLKIARLLICNDSGMMHMAGALSTPIVAIFGPTTRELGFYPYRTRFEVADTDISCRPCHHIGSNQCPKGHHQCMTDVDVVDVIEFAERFLDHGDEGVPEPGGNDEVP